MEQIEEFSKRPSSFRVNERNIFNYNRNNQQLNKHEYNINGVTFEQLNNTRQELTDLIQQTENSIRNEMYQKFNQFSRDNSDDLTKIRNIIRKSRDRNYVITELAKDFKKSDSMEEDVESLTMEEKIVKIIKNLLNPILNPKGKISLKNLFIILKEMIHDFHGSKDDIIEIVINNKELKVDRGRQICISLEN